MSGYDLLMCMAIFQTATASAVTLMCLVLIFRKKYLILHGGLFFSALYHSFLFAQYTIAIFPNFSFLSGQYYLWHLIRSVLYSACLISGGVLLISRKRIVSGIHLIGVSLVIVEMMLTLMHGIYTGE